MSKNLLFCLCCVADKVAFILLSCSSRTLLTFSSSDEETLLSFTVWDSGEPKISEGIWTGSPELVSIVETLRGGASVLRGVLVYISVASESLSVLVTSIIISVV